MSSKLPSLRMGLVKSLASLFMDVYQLLSTRFWLMGLHMDLISPALFTLLANLLSRIFARAENDGRILGIKISRTSPQILHLMYADDHLIYCKVNKEEAGEVKKCLDQYCLWTGQ